MEATNLPKEKNPRPQKQDSFQLKNELPTERGARQGQLQVGGVGVGRAEGQGALEGLTVAAPCGADGAHRTALLSQGRGEKLEPGVTRPQSSSLSLCPTVALTG